MDSLLDKTEGHIKEQVRIKAKDKLGLSRLQPTGVLTGIIETLASVVAWIYTTFLQPLQKQTNLDTATDTFLDSWGNLLAVPRKPASKAQGNVQIQAYQAGTIKKGSTINIQSTTLAYTISQDINFTTGTFTVPVQAEKTGLAYSSFDPQKVTASINPVIAGITNITFPQNWYTSPGSEIETDTSYRQRIKAQWLKTAAGDVPVLYEAEAQSIKGIEEAKVFRTPNGYGSVRIVVRGANNTQPTDALIQQVYTHLNTVGLVARQMIVEKVKIQNLTITGTFKGTLTQQQAENRVSAYIQTLKIGQSYTIQGIYNLFDDQANIHISKPTQNDPTFPADAVYNATITITKET